MPAAPTALQHAPATPHAAFNVWTIGTMAFLTVIDLFSTQAILPALAARFDAPAANVAAAANACTLGMAAAGLFVALFSRFIPRRIGITACLAVLAIPTLMLGWAETQIQFAALRVAQGVFMSAAYTLTLAHLGERCSASAGPAAFAAYVTGNVTSNLVGRVLATQVAAHAGLEATFLAFAGLNCAGAALAWFAISHQPQRADLVAGNAHPLTALRMHLADPALRTGFAIGFLILFAFVGVFSYVSFTLVAPPYALSMGALGLVYAVFVPAIATTPQAGAVARRLGVRTAICLGFICAAIGIGLTLLASLPLLLIGLTLIGAGTFFAQAATTSFVSHRAATGKAAASGLYLTSYYLGGLVGAPALGALYQSGGWPACAIGAGAALIAGALLAWSLPPASMPSTETFHARS